MPYGPTVHFGLFNVVLRHDIKGDLENMSEQFPHLVFENFKTNIGLRIHEILKNIFPVPKLDSKRLVTFYNKDDYISFRHHTFKKEGKEVDLSEVGPRFEMRPYQVMLGTIDMPESKKEWALRPYINTAKKANQI